MGIVMSGGSDVLKIGVIGSGTMGAHHAAALNGRIHGAVVTAVCAGRPESARRLLETLPAAEMFTSADELIAADTVDAVVVASPGHLHADHVRAALAAAKPVLCEKPLATTAADAHDLVRAEAKVGKRLITTGFMRRYDPDYRAVRTLCESGDLGIPLMAHATVRTQEVPPSFTNEMLVHDAIIHDVDVTRWLFDEEIASITVHQSRSSGQYSNPDLNDPVLAVMRTTSGRVSSVSMMVNSRSGYQVRLEVTGDSGSAAIGHDMPVMTRRSNGTWGGKITQDFRQRFRVAYDAQLQDWVTSTLNGQPVYGATARDGYAAAVVCEAGVRAVADPGVAHEVEMPAGRG